jgi:hypothetical protein
MIHTALRSALAAALVATLPSTGLAGGEHTAEESSSARALFVAMLSGEQCTPSAEHECGAPCMESWKASEKLGAMLVKKPASWTVIEPLVFEEFEGQEASRGRIITFLASCGSDGCIAAGEELYAKTPASFSETQMLAFAEQESEPFNDELTKRVKKSKCETVLPAAYLAFHGDDAGAKALKKAVAAELDETNVVDALIAALALERLGAEDVTVATHRRVHDAVLAALDEGDLERARGMALRAEAVHKTFAAEGEYGGKYGKSKKVSLSYFEKNLGWHVRERSKEVATADDIFTLIEKVTPVS